MNRVLDLSQDFTFANLDVLHPAFLRARFRLIIHLHDKRFRCADVAVTQDAVDVLGEPGPSPIGISRDDHYARVAQGLMSDIPFGLRRYNMDALRSLDYPWVR